MMNKWLLFFLLHCCALVQASYYKTEDQSIALERTIAEVHQKIGLRSMYADLIVIADHADLEAAYCLIKDDLYLKNTGCSPDRHLLFIKAMIARMALNKDAYTFSQISNRVLLRRNIEENRSWIKFCEIVDKALNGAATDLNKNYISIIRSIVLDVIALCDWDEQASPNHPDSAKVVTQQHIVCLKEHQHLSNISSFCKDILSTCLRNLYNFYGENISKGEMSRVVQSMTPHFWDRLANIFEPAPKHTGRYKDEIVSFLKELSDKELSDVHYLIHAPFLNPAISRGMLIKILLFPQDSTHVRIERSVLIAGISERLTEEKDPTKPVNVRFRKNLSDFIQRLETAFENKESMSNPFYKKLIVNLTPEKKARIKQLIKLYATCGFYDSPQRKTDTPPAAHGKQEKKSVSPLDDVDATPLFDMLKDESNPDALKAQILDMCATTNDDATQALLLLVLKDVQDLRGKKKLLLGEGKQLQQRVDEEHHQYVQAYETIKEQEKERDRLLKRRQAIAQFGENARKEIAELRANAESFRKKLEELRGRKPSVTEEEELNALKMQLARAQASNEALTKQVAHLERSNQSLRGAVTKIKKKSDEPLDAAEIAALQPKQKKAKKQSEKAEKPEEETKSIESKTLDALLEPYGG